MTINGETLLIRNWEITPAGAEVKAEMPDDAAPCARRETAAERARSMEFTGRHRRRR